jgi:hypothetical protein
MPLYAVHSIAASTKRARKLNRQLIALSKVRKNSCRLHNYLAILLNYTNVLIERKFLGFSQRTNLNNLQWVDMQLGLANDKPKVTLAVKLCLACVMIKC